MSDVESIEVFADLSNYEAQIEELIKRKWWSSVPLTSFPASWLSSGEQRLDGGYYANDTFQALLLLQKRGFRLERLKSLVSDTFVMGRFKRVYATDKEAGWPYLSASEALMFRPESNRYIAKDHAPKNANGHFVEEGWILISCSGTVGRMTVTSKRLEKFFLTHDLIRIVPSDEIPIGFIYAYLSSWIGQALLSKDQYGSAIKHIEPHHVDRVPVPLIDKTDQKRVHSMIMRAFELRAYANSLLDEANTVLHDLLGLPEFNDDLVEYYTRPNKDETDHIPPAKSFVLSALNLSDRLDGSYHVPVASTAVKLVRQAKYEAIMLGRIVDRVYVAPRFKRIYVPEEYGTEFLQGSHLTQFSPDNLRYISNTLTKGLERWIISEGWVLVTCSGTIGRVGIVPSAHDRWAASQHILRIVPKENESHAGYIMAFLTTPYGQHQLKSKIYGAVVDELTEADTEAVWIPNAPYDVQKEIGQKVVEAYEKKELANQIEDEAIGLLESILEGKDMKNKQRKKEEKEPKIDWAFTPKLGYEVEPELTEEELDDFLGRLVAPSPKPSDPKKKGTSE